MTKEEIKIIESTKEFAKTHNIYFDEMTEKMILNAMREQLQLGVVVGRSEQLADFCKKVSSQKDCPAEFQEIVNKEFWNLIS